MIMASPLAPLGPVIPLGPVGPVGPLTGAAAEYNCSGLLACLPKGKRNNQRS